MISWLKTHRDHRYTRLIFLAVAVLVALGYDWFLWNKQLGLGFLVYIIFILALYLFFIIPLKEDRQRWSLSFLLPLIALSATPVFYSNDLVRFGVPWFVLILLVLFIAVFPVGNPSGYAFTFLN